jgi:hypothetical protein
VGVGRNTRGTKASRGAVDPPMVKNCHNVSRLKRAKQKPIPLLDREELGDGILNNFTGVLVRCNSPNYTSSGGRASAFNDETGSLAFVWKTWYVLLEQLARTASIFLSRCDMARQ